jgi:transposase
MGIRSGSAKMANPLVLGEFWELVEPLLPSWKQSSKGGVGNREALAGILFVLRTGFPWEMLPQEMGCAAVA